MRKHVKIFTAMLITAAMVPVSPAAAACASVSAAACASASVSACAPDMIVPECKNSETAVRGGWQTGGTVQPVIPELSGEPCPRSYCDGIIPGNQTCRRQRGQCGWRGQCGCF